MEKKPDSRLKENIILIVLGVTLLVALLNLKAVANAAGILIGLIMPIFNKDLNTILVSLTGSTYNIDGNFFEKIRPL